MTLFIFASIYKDFTWCFVFRQPIKTRAAGLDLFCHRVCDSIELTDKVLRVVAREHLEYKLLSAINTLTSIFWWNGVNYYTCSLWCWCTHHQEQSCRQNQCQSWSINNQLNKTKNIYPIMPEWSVNRNCCADVEVLDPGDRKEGAGNDEHGLLPGEVAPDEHQHHLGPGPVRGGDQRGLSNYVGLFRLQQQLVDDGQLVCCCHGDAGCNLQ